VRRPAVPNFTLIRKYLGFSPLPQKTKNCQNCQLFRPAGGNPLPDVDEIRRVYAGNRSTEVTNIWCDSVGRLGIYRQITAMGHFTPKFSESLAPKLLVRLKKKSVGAKMVRTSSYFLAKFGERRREKEKLGVFVSVFVCLFVCHALDLELE